MKKARSIVAFLMAAAMLAATACSQSGGESSSQGSSAAEGSSAASEASQGGDGETHDIVYWDMAWGGEDERSCPRRWRHRICIADLG